jgi:transcriptional regulator with GAF, ATPase, and Fis domain
MQVSFHVLGDQLWSFAEASTRWLELTEVLVQRADACCAAAYCSVMVFDERSVDVLQAVRVLSGSGAVRVIALDAGAAGPSLDCWELLDAGAADVLQTTDPAAAGEQILARLRRWDLIEELLHSDWVKRELIGNSPTWQRKLRDLIEVAYFTSSPVLIEGESGTGKERAAHLIHHFDPQAKPDAWVVLDCTTIVPELSGSEFFGHERGAFTGAVCQRDGAFAQAHGGTLFLDEVGELPLPLQAQLLRVIQEKTYKRVGGNAWYRTEFRLVCATNRKLEDLVRAGQFRADLYFRIAGMVCTLPPLRERLEDILPLVEYFMQQGSPHEVPVLDDATRAYFLQREYHGNVRELRQLVARAMYRYPGGGVISVGSIAPEERPAACSATPDWRGGAFEQGVRRAVVQGAQLKEIGRAAEELAVRTAVEAASGSLQQAAQKLGVTDRALQLRRAQSRSGDGLSRSAGGGIAH